MSEDDIQIITESEYYRHFDDVFYIEPIVARSLLSEYLIKEPTPSNLRIHVDTRTKRQRFREFITEMSEHFGLHSAVIPLTHVVDHYLGTGGLLSFTAAGIAGALYFRLKKNAQPAEALPEPKTTDKIEP